MPERLDELTMARRVAAELQPGQVVALGAGLPARVAEAAPADAHLQFLWEDGTLGYRGDGRDQPATLRPGGSFVSLADWAGILRGGHVDVVVVQPARVSAAGDLVGLTTASAPGLFPPGASVDLSAGAGRVIAMLPHTSPGGASHLVADSSPLSDGHNCVSLVVTDLGVMEVTGHGLVLSEVAPGWRAEDVVALTAAPLAVSPRLRELNVATAPADAGPGKVYPDGPSAIGDLPAGATVMIDGFGGPGGMAHYLLVTLRDLGTQGLTIISNTAGIARSVNFGTPPGKLAIDHSILIDNGQVIKAIATYPVSPSPSRPNAFELAYRRGDLELELVPQGTLAERLRAGGAGIAAFYTPTGAGTLIAQGKESRVIDGKEYILETALTADYCLIRGYKADTLGNVVYKGTSRNFNAVMAPAARITVVEVDEVVEPGQLDPELIVTPGIFVDRIVRRPEGFSAYE